MARFKQVPQHYVLDKVMEYWLNMVRNYREDAPSRRTVDRRLSSASRLEGLNHEIDERPERCGARRDRCWKADWRMT